MTTMQVDDFKGLEIYIDTNFFYHFLRPDPTYKQSIKGFFRKIEDGRIRALTSINAFDELAYRLVLALIKDKYGGDPLGLLRKKRKRMLSEFYPSVVQVVKRLELLPHLETLEVTSRDLNQALGNMTRLLLMPRDALHLAVMQRMKIGSIASDDRDFDSMKGIERVWLYNPPEKSKF